MKLSSRFCGSLVLVALVLLVVGLVARPAYASIIQQPTDEETWAGLYAGVHLGYGWANGETRFTPLPSAPVFVNLAQTELDPPVRGVLGGAQVGINWQRKKLVFGIETDFSGTGISGESIESPIIQNSGVPFPGVGYILAKQEVDFFGTLRAKVGLALCPKLFVYGTAGMAYGRVTYTANTNFLPPGTIQYPVSTARMKLGWTAGLGAEYALTSRLSVKGDYLYYDLGRESVTANPVPALPPFQVEYKWHTSAHTMNVGLNYKF